jgi:hypothetical protein
MIAITSKNRSFLFDKKIPLLPLLKEDVFVEGGEGVAERQRNTTTALSAKCNSGTNFPAATVRPISALLAPFVRALELKRLRRE